MSKFDYKQFKIGDFVEVARLVRRGRKKDETETVNRWLLPDGKKLLRDGKKTRIGVITGVKYMATGETSWEGEIGHIFCQSGSVTVWRVRFGLAGKEWCALPEDLKPCEPLAKFPIATVIWNDQDREMMRNEMKDIPRDEKGRW